MLEGPLLLHDYLLRAAHRLPQKIALVAGEERLSYREINERSNALARALVRRGVRRGDRVLVLSDNSPAAVIYFWAVLKANAVVSMVSPLTKVDKLTYLLNDSGASALLTEGRLAQTALQAAASAPGLHTILVAAEPAGAELLGKAVLLRDAVRDEDRSAPPPRCNIDIDLAAIIYTSGSTGEPKGVMLTHRNMLAAATSITTYLENVEDDILLGVLPLSFDYGLYQMIMAFRVGARLVLERSFVYPAHVLGRVAREKVTGFPGVPTLFALLAEMKNIKEYDLSSIRYVTNTAAALPVKHIRALQAIFPHARIFSMYGLTECKRCTYLPPERLADKPESVGIAIPNTELWLVDEDDRKVGPGEVGQLVIRGATVMRGYWNKPGPTAERLRPGPLPGEMVLYTGDYCRLDEEGYLYFVGRMDSILKVRGEKVAPKEIEMVLSDVAGVKEAAVVGVPDEILGEAPKAFVVLESGAIVTERELRRACQARLEPFMVPKEIEIVADLPKTTTGKIQKRGLI